MKAEESLLPEDKEAGNSCEHSKETSPLPLEKVVGKLGDRSSSDVIVRIRTLDGKDDWFYCHSSILCEHSKYFAARLSDDWPTYQLLDSRNCVEVYCSETDIDQHIMLLRFFYSEEECIAEMWHSVRNALGILKVAAKLGCDGIVDKCMQYLEAVPWEENEELEILKTLPILGSSMFPVLARIQPVDSEAVRSIFISAVRVATLPERKSSEGLGLENYPSELKAAAQEQVEYMLVEDEDAPLLVADKSVKVELKKCFTDLFEDFKTELAALHPEAENVGELSDEFLLERVLDLAWAARVLPKVGLLHEMVIRWTEVSDELINVLTDHRLKDTFWETKFRVLDLTSKVLEAVGYGSVILPTEQRTRLVKLWLPYIREIKPLLDASFLSGKVSQRMDGDLSQTIELALVSLILTLPSSDQAYILADWLKTEQVRYPDLTEAFEIWCFRSKSAKRRISSELSGVAGSTAPILGDPSFLWGLREEAQRPDVGSGLEFRLSSFVNTWNYSKSQISLLLAGT
ncbi:hypothetical protein R1sor_010849 [Riccia sorocarpa]|uniref:BTB domain-containing protein n=1 Tax=Riccia sorocarpa TaxID=122646 RepID=A0ABD3HZJ3_9MARC